MSHARVKALPYRSTHVWSWRELSWPTLSHSYAFLFLLLIATLFSGLMLTYVQTQNRMLFAETQQMQKTADSLRVRYAQYLLEQSTWASQPRIQAIAEHNLQMSLPSNPQIIITP